MREKIKKSWTKVEIALIKAWCECEKGFRQIDEENNLPSGTLFKLVNSIQDYRGTRASLRRWLREHGSPLETGGSAANKTPKKKKMAKKTSLPKSTDQSGSNDRQLARELKEAHKKIASLEAQQAKDALRRDFLEGQIEEYRKLVKPSQSEKSSTK